MADRKTGSGKKVSTLGIKDPAVRRVIEELAARIAALEAAVGKGT
jgi:hypothetical protein